jgi:hypothetical protein
LLHVVAPYNNPVGWSSRLANFRRFEDAMLATPCVSLTTAELAYGNRPFVLGPRRGIRRLQLRCRDVLWHKENLINIAMQAVRHAPEGYDYGAYVDGDLLFFDPSWAERTIAALQVFDLVQVSEDLIFLGPHGQFAGRGVSFMHCWRHARHRHRCGKWYNPGNPPCLERHGYPGGAWAWRREAFDAMGGLLDICILGAGDISMALGLTGLPDLQNRDYTEAYRAAIADWGERARAAIGLNLGSVPGIVFHLWHGKTEDRGYSTRGQILVRNRFDPRCDLVRDHRGLAGFAGNKPYLRADVAAYFAERNEDSVDL